MRTQSGALAPITEHGEVRLEDLVVQLGREGRFGNAGNPEWTVLHHSMLVALIWLKAGFPRDGMPYAMLHDGHEYVTKDIPSPVKAEIRKAAGNDPFQIVESAIDGRIRDTLSLPAPDSLTRGRIKLCDWAALAVEAVFFGGPGSRCLDVAPEKFRPAVRLLVNKAFPHINLDLLAGCR